MADIQKVKELRDQTGVGVMEAAKCLESAGGDLEKAIELAHGISSRMKARAGNSGNGIIASYISDDGSRGAMVELLCETDFAARTEEFKRATNLAAYELATGSKDWIIQTIIPGVERHIKEPVRLGRCEVFDLRD